MGAIEPRPIEILTEADAAAGLALSLEAGWNQNEADWLFFMSHGTAFGIREPGGRVVATAAVLPYRDRAWIGLVLVTETWRRLGLGRALLLRCLAEADGAGLPAWLDATPAGAAIYRPLGFGTMAGIVRLRRSPREATAAPPPLASLDRLGRLDAAAFGTDRQALLSELAGRPGSAAFGDADACCLVRDGSRARHVGPVLARSQEHAARLLRRVAASEPGARGRDRAAAEVRVGAAVEARGFSVERPFERMARGTAIIGTTARPATAGAGPEYG